jgi:hypothetical protein
MSEIDVRSPSLWQWHGAMLGQSVEGESCLMQTATGWIVRGLAIVAALLATAQPVLASFAFVRGGDLSDRQRCDRVGALSLTAQAVHTLTSYRVIDPARQRSTQRSVELIRASFAGAREESLCPG